VPENSGGGARAIPVSIAVHAAAVVAILTVSGARAVVVEEKPKEAIVYTLGPKEPAAAPRAADPVKAPARRIVNRAPNPEAPIRIATPAPLPDPETAADPMAPQEIEPQVEMASNDPNAMVCPTCLPSEPVGIGHGDPNDVGGPGGDRVVPIQSILDAPRKVHDVAPRYPDPLRRAGIQGQVSVDCVIGPDGRVREARAVGGNLMFASAALEAVKQWVYSAPRLSGQPVSVALTVTVHFRLNR
jgi:protein TonB